MKFNIHTTSHWLYNFLFVWSGCVCWCFCILTTKSVYCIELLCSTGLEHSYGFHWSLCSRTCFINTTMTTGAGNILPVYSLKWSATPLENPRVIAVRFTFSAPCSACYLEYYWVILNGRFWVRHKFVRSLSFTAHARWPQATRLLLQHSGEVRAADRCCGLVRSGQEERSRPSYVITSSSFCYIVERLHGREIKIEEWDYLIFDDCQ